MDGTVITRKGTQLLAKVMAAKSVLNFTRVSVGTGLLPGGYDPASMINLVQYKMDGVISKCVADGDVAKVTMQISSAGIETGFTVTEMGVFAQDPDIGEVLYAYLDMNEDPQYIYAEGGKTQKFMEVTLEVAIEANAKVTAYINPESMVTREDFELELEKKADKDGGDASDMITNIEEPESSGAKYPGINAKSPVKQILGYLYRWVKSLKADKVSVTDIVNNCTSTDTDKPLAAAQGKTLWDKIVDVLSALTAHKASGDHDGRYYTETEMDGKLAGKSNTNHGHSGMLTTGDLVDNCTSTATNKAPTAKQAKTLWDKITDAVSALATHKSSGDHDGRYYTESEMNSKLAGKSDTSHNHDSAYIKKDGTAEVGGIRVGDKATSGYGWIDIYYKGVHEFSIYAESGTGLIIKPATPLATLHQYINVLCQLQHKGNLVVDSSYVVDNCTSTTTYNVLSANQGRVLMDKLNQLNSDKLDKSSSQQLVTNQNFSITENFKQITTNSKIPNSGYLQFIFGVGMERYSVLFDPVRNIIQPFYIGQSADYNFYLKLRIDSDTKVSVSVNSLKGYTLSDFANKPIWMRTYYAN